MQESPDTALLPTDPESQADANAEGQPGEGDEGNGSTSSASDEETETGENSKKVKASKPARKPGPGAVQPDEGQAKVQLAILLDTSGTITNAWRKVRVKGHVEAVLEAAKAL